MFGGQLLTAAWVSALSPTTSPNLPSLSSLPLCNSALEHSPEVFGSIIMLYCEMEVNGVPLKVRI